MKIKVNTVLKTLEGKPMEFKGDEKLTLGLVCVNALLFPDEKEKDAIKKVEKFHLALRLSDKKVTEPELTVEEVVLIKQCINIAYTQPLVVGKAHDMLEQKEDK